MATSGPSEDIYVPADFACEAIPGPSARPAGFARQGRNEGMSVVGEFVSDGGNGSGDASSPSSVGLADAVRSEAGRLAALFSTSADPVGTATLFHKLLLDELATLHRSAAGGGSPA